MNQGRKIRKRTRARLKKPRQGSFEFPNGWGGVRRGAGRKPKGTVAGVSHRTRAVLAARFPVHVTMKARRRSSRLCAERSQRGASAEASGSCTSASSRITCTCSSKVAAGPPWRAKVWNALRYVLCNARKHGGWRSSTHHDPCSSAAWFDGWRDGPVVLAEASITARARTWFLSKGWRRRGLLRIENAPAGSQAPA